MSYATEALKQALLYNPQSQTLYLSPHVQHLSEVHSALATAFGKEDVQLREVQELTASVTPPDSIELLCLQAVGDMFGYSRRDIYLEFGLKGRDVVSLLVIVPLPSFWTLTTAFDTLSPASLPAQGQLAASIIVISYGLTGVTGSRTFQEHDKNDPTVIELSGYPLQNGFQILAKPVEAGGDAIDPTLRTRALTAEIPADILPPADQPPERVRIRADVAEGWLVYERWWDTLPPPGLNEAGVHSAGLALRYDLGHPADFTASAVPAAPDSYWLQEIGTFDYPIVLEAVLLGKGDDPQARADFYPVRYSSRLVNRTPLGAASTALEGLLGKRASSIFEQLDKVLPDAISLLAFTYAPTEYIRLTFAAGDTTDSDKHLITVGPDVALREVDFTLQLPIGREQTAYEIELEGWATFFDVDFRVHLRPWTFLEGGLDDLHGVNLGQLVQKATDLTLPFGLDSVKLTQAWVTCYLDEQSKAPLSTDLLLRLEGKVDLVLNAVQLEAIELEFSHSRDGSNTGRFTAQLSLGPITLSVLVSYEGDGWVLRGTAHANENAISLTALVDHLVHNFGATVPADIPDIYLQTFSLEYRTATRALQIETLTDWTLPEGIPVLGGSENEVHLQLTMQRDPQQGTQSALYVEWTLEKNQHHLTANAYLSRDAQTFGFDFSVPDPATPVTLTQLTTELGLPNLPAPAARVLDAIFQVSTLALDYDRTAKHFAVAWSRPLPDAGGLLLTEYDQRNDGVGSRQVNVSWLPLQAEETIGIENLLHLLDAPDVFATLTELLGTVGLAFIVQDVKELLTFRQLGFSWQEGGGNDVITVTALSTFPQGSYNPRGAEAYSNGTKAFIALYRGQTQGIVAGVSLVEEPLPPVEGSDATAAPIVATPPILPTFLPSEVGDLLKVIEEVLDSIVITHLLVSTITSRTYRPPTYSPDRLQPSYAVQGVPPTNPFGSNFVVLSPGLALGVRVRVGESGLLSKIMDGGDLEGHITLGRTIGLQCSLPGSLSLEVGVGNQLVLSQPMLQLKTGAMGVEIDVAGVLELHLFDQVIAFRGWLSLTPEAVQVHIELDELPIEVPFGVPGLPGVTFIVDKDHPLYGEAGYQFEPPGLDLGFSGAFTICSSRGKAYDYSGRVTFVLEIVEAVPQPLYVSFAMDRLNLATILEAKTGVVYYMRQAEEKLALAENVVGGVIGDAAHTADDAIHTLQDGMAHVEALLSNIELEDAGFHWADSIVQLPDGTTALPGVGFQGKLQLFGWNAFALLEFSAEGFPGITGHFETEPINLLNIIKISGDGQGIRAKPKSAADLDDLDDLQKQDQELSSATEDWYLKPGGPILHLSTRSSPFLHANLHAELFGTLKADVRADITKDGFEFDFAIAAGTQTNGVSTHLNCHWWKQEGRFEASGDLGLHLNGTLGPLIPGVAVTEIHLDANLDAHVQLTVDSEKFELIVNGSFEYEGATLTLPQLTLDVAFSDITALVARVWDHIKALAKEIFEDVLAPVGEAIAAGAKAVAAVAVETVQLVGDVASKTAEEVGAIAAQTTALVERGLTEVADEVSQLKDQATALVNGAADAALEFAAPVLAAAEQLVAEAQVLIANTLEAVGEIAAAAQKVLDDAVDYANRKAAEVLLEVRKWVDDAKRLAANLIQDARVAALAIAAEAGRLIADIEGQLSAVLDDIANLENLIAGFLSGAVDAVEDAGGTVIHSVSHGFGLW